ncbi:MAG: hypothetical protein RBS99_06360 [Rhodospirillales bacterium]|nr:hypothetical protein [Rhodospirillales bacterium]
MITRRLLMAGLATLALAACETPVTVQRFPGITFAHLPALGLNVGRVEIVSSVQPTMQAVQAASQFPVPPDKAMRRWAEDRLVAKGVTNVARFTIVDASVTETPLAIEGGVAGVFKKEQSVRYEATVAGMIEVIDDQGFRRAFASSRVGRSKTLREDASLNERDRLRFDLIEALMKDFNTEMEQDIRTHLGAFAM